MTKDELRKTDILGDKPAEANGTEAKGESNADEEEETEAKDQANQAEDAGAPEKEEKEDERQVEATRDINEDANEASAGNADKSKEPDAEWPHQEANKAIKEPEAYGEKGVGKAWDYDVMKEVAEIEIKRGAVWFWEEKRGTNCLQGVVEWQSCVLRAVAMLAKKFCMECLKYQRLHRQMYRWYILLN